jgi:hypothetical protein
LSPEEQDRVWELAEKVKNTLEGLEPGITTDEFRESERLLAKVPRLGPGETFAGPKIEVPRALQRYWSWVKPIAAMIRRSTEKERASASGDVADSAYDALPIHFCNSTSGTLRPCSGKI